ncbi:MAG: porin family protein, partial [Bacteroidota bacterium]
MIQFTKKISSLFLLIVLVFSTSHAQNVSIQLEAGVFLGSPFTLDGVPEGSTGNPLVGPHGGLSFSYHLNERMALRLGAMYSKKGSEYLVPISGRTRVERSIFGLNFEIPFNLSYEGTAEGMYDNEYIDLPLSFVFRNKKGSLAVTGGPYAAYLLKGYHQGTVNVRVANLFNVNDEPFDQSELIRPWDYGVHLGTEFRILDRIYGFASGMFGLASVFSENPEGLEGT